MTVNEMTKCFARYYGKSYSKGQIQEIIRYFAALIKDHAHFLEYVEYLYDEVLKTVSTQFGKLPDIEAFERCLPMAIEKYYKDREKNVALPPPRKDDDPEPFLDRDKMADELRTGMQSLAQAKNLKPHGIGKEFDFTQRDHGIIFAEAHEAAKYLGLDGEDQSLFDLIDRDRGQFDRAAKRKRICAQCFDDLYNCSCEPKGYPLTWKPDIKEFRFVPCGQQIKKEEEDKAAETEKKKEQARRPKKQQWERW